MDFSSQHNVLYMYTVYMHSYVQDKVNIIYMAVGQETSYTCLMLHICGSHIIKTEHKEYQ